nr:hypothetical protein [Tanacetum cinerariifolium]
MAEAYLGYDFYMPAFIDFRGRIYHSASAFHFKSFKSIWEAQEWCRVVLVPALKKVHDFNQNKAVGVCLDTHILNEFGIEDPSHDKPGQLSFVNLAKNAKDPFQFLSSVIPILSQGDPSLMYNSPITKDASASAFQIISFLLLDEKMARLTNLIPDENGILQENPRNLKENLDGVNLKTSTKLAIAAFFKRFYADLEQSEELVNKVKECRRDTVKEEVFELLKANSPIDAAPEMVKSLIKKDLPSAKEYLRARHLTDEDMDLVGEL